MFSFNGNKIITTSGGGMLVGDDEEALKKRSSGPLRPGIRLPGTSIRRWGTTTG